MQVNNFFLLTRLLFIDLHFFIATIQIGVIVQVCYTPQARLLSNLFTSCRIPTQRHPDPVLVYVLRRKTVSLGSGLSYIETGNGVPSLSGRLGGSEPLSVLE